MPIDKKVVHINRKKKLRVPPSKTEGLQDLGENVIPLKSELAREAFGALPPDIAGSVLSMVDAARGEIIEDFLVGAVWGFLCNHKRSPGSFIQKIIRLDLLTKKGGAYGKAKEKKETNEDPKKPRGKT